MIDDDALVEPAPGAGPLSTTTTERPPRASSRATAEPITPAPITMASTATQANSSGISARRAGDELAQLLVDGVVDRRRLVGGEALLPDAVGALGGVERPSSSHCSKLALSAVSER